MSFPQGCQSRAEVALLLKCQAKIDMRQGIAGIEVERFLIMDHGAVQIAGVFQGVGEVVVAQRQGRIEIERLAIGLDSSLHVSLGLQSVPEVQVSWGIVGVESKRLLERA